MGRVTLYGHFPSRDALVEAALTRVLAEGEELLAGLDLTGDPRDALRVLIRVELAADRPVERRPGGGAGVVAARARARAARRAGATRRPAKHLPGSG